MFELCRYTFPETRHRIKALLKLGEEDSGINFSKSFKKKERESDGRSL